MFTYKYTVLEYADGTSEELLLEPAVSQPSNGVYSVSTVLKNPKKQVYKLKNVFCVSEKYAYSLVQDFFNSGINKVSALGKNVTSKFFFSLFDKNGKGITFLNNVPSKFYSEMHYFKKENEISLDTVIPLSYDGEVFSETFNIFCGMPYYEALEKNADMCGVKQDWENVVGWGSWDYYFTSVDEEAVKENTDFIAGDSELSDKIKYIAIDDGWQQREGDWCEGARFPHGIAATAQYIRSKGYIPGIWTAPTRLHYLCGTVMRRNDFLVRNQYGDPVNDEEFYVLDPTHPDGESFIRETFTYLKNAGYGFYKIDFLSNLLRCDRFYDKRAGHYDALRKLITTIRECVGDESHIMGCSLPYGYGGGEVNSRRTGLDIHNTWNHIVKCSQIFLPVIPAQRRLYQNDMDYLVVRGPETSSESDTNVLNPKRGEYAAVKSEKFRWREGSDFNYDEAKFWCTEVLMTGSSVVLSDRMNLLNQKGLKLVKTTVKYADFDAARPVDTGARLPEVWYKKSAEALYILNFSEKKKNFCIDTAALGITDENFMDIFENTLYTVHGSKLKVTLMPRQSMALYIEE